MQLDGKRGRRSELDATFLVLVGIAWASGLVYLVVRANLPSPVRLVIVDGLHVYVGLASIVFVIALLATQAPLRAFQTGRALRQLRWLLGGLYLVLFGAGALLALPWSAPVRTFFVDLHLLAAVWSVVPTGWYLVHDRSATLRSGMTSRSVVALVLILAPAALVVVIAPRMIAPLTLTGAGAAWREQGLPQRFIDRMATSPNGQDLVAGGEGLYVRRPSDQRWQQVAFPSELVLSVALSPIAAYVGTTHGVYASEQVGGPYRKLPLPSFEVHGIAVDSQDPNVIWVSSRGGFWLSANGGHAPARWARASGPLTDAPGQSPTPGSRAMEVAAPFTSWQSLIQGGLVRTRPRCSTASRSARTEAATGHRCALDCRPAQSGVCWKSVVPCLPQRTVASSPTRSICRLLRT